MGVQLDETEKRIVDLIEANRDEIIAFARDMYTHAELGYKEFKTAEKFTRLMKKLTPCKRASGSYRRKGIFKRREKGQCKSGADRGIRRSSHSGT